MTAQAGQRYICIPGSLSDELMSHTLADIFYASSLSQLHMEQFHRQSQACYYKESSPVTSNWVKEDKPDWIAAKRPCSVSRMSAEGELIEHVPPLVALTMAP